MSSENTFDYNSAGYKKFLKKFRDTDLEKSSLIVFAGSFNTNREAALDEFKREIIGEPVEIDLAEIITPYEEESYQNIDRCLNSINKDEELVIFRNAEQLNGAYTAYSTSIVRYGSPQEKYFVKKLAEIPVPAILELKDEDQLDRFLQRKADAVFLFKAPTSLLERLAWKVKNIHVHGSSFLSPRPH
ncbi:hypothetical protein [Gracilimonas sp.]|uniref:hypothetical protein n=1 Tax=Gracilimonas sp. TaxID=1974203 RepID=UPI002871B9E2|nr:hypothetical protein [Gracilimonas sp.]